MPEPATGVAGEGGARRFLTFNMEDRTYALPAEEVLEVIRTPAVARVPQGPRSLLGVANLRGSVVPVACLRGLLGRDRSSSSVSARAIVLGGAAPVALAVDSVGALVSVAAGGIETGHGALVSRPGERLRGAFRLEGGQGVIGILDVGSLLADAFAQRARPPRARAATAVSNAGGGDSRVTRRERLLTFEVAGQEYALGLDVVQEIIPAPAALTTMPLGEAVLLGVAVHRDGLLPVLSLRRLLGLATVEAVAAGKVLVVRFGGSPVGLLADRMRAIIDVDADRLDPPPPILAARAGGESRIEALYRGEDGRRLIAILAPDQLFREDVMRRLDPQGAGERLDASPAAADRPPVHFLVFRLGESEFGLPIAAVDAVTTAPDRITRVPRTPAFLEGVINLRGEVLPIVDQRRRFDMPPLKDGESRRLVIVRTQRHRAGLIVDSVSEVLRGTSDIIEPAPDLTGEAVRLVDGVINLEDAGRLVLLLDPDELLSRAERGVLDGLTAGGEAADL